MFFPKKEEEEWMKIEIIFFNRYYLY
jgi:hypothetical protein